MEKSYTITREIRPDCQAIIFEFDQDSAQDLFRDFSQLKSLGAHAWRHRRLSSVVWYRRLWLWICYQLRQVRLRFNSRFFPDKPMKFVKLYPTIYPSKREPVNF